MKLQKIAILLLPVLFSFSCGTKPGKQARKETGSDVTFVNQEAEKKVDVMIDGKLFTSYCWFDNVFKPVLYPVVTSAGTEITRGFPITPRENERTDHAHQIGNWLNYGNVNGIDFWGNGSQGLGVKSPNGGVIKHRSIEKQTPGTGEGVMVTTASWLTPKEKEIIKERTEFHFIGKGNMRIIDRITTWTATDTTVTFKDTKEGMFGIRVARQLELPTIEDIVLKEAKGGTTTVKALSNEGITGNYRSSEGVTGEAVWSTRAKWMDLYGNIGDEKISLVICDHPKNPSYPTYWHARGYGLFAANPFGVKDFTQGKGELNYNISPGQSVTMRYRIIVNSGSHLTYAEINALSDDFSAKY